MTEEAKAHKAEGSLAAIPVMKINNNPYRPDAVFLWMEDKIQGMAQTFKVDGFQSTMEVTVDKWDKIYLAGGGHHRTETLRRIINGDFDWVKPEDVRGLFKNDDDEWCVKIVKKKYTKEQMLRNFMIENAEMWGKDEDQNTIMMTYQVKNHLDGLLKDSESLEKFIDSVNSPFPLKMDERAYSRAKNKNGVGATTVCQYLGEQTWKRPTVEKAVQVMFEPGKEGEKLRELAEQLPNAAIAYSFKTLMVQQIGDEKVLSSADDQDKAQKLIEKEALSRSDLEKANKLKKENDLSPLAALSAVVEEKKDEKKAAAPEPKKKPDQKKVKPAEETLTHLKAARGFLKLMVSEDDDWSKEQAKVAKSLIADILKDSKELITKVIGNDKKKKK